MAKTCSLCLLYRDKGKDGQHLKVRESRRRRRRRAGYRRLGEWRSKRMRKGGWDEERKKGKKEGRNSWI